MYAVGLDVVATERISRILERFGERFVNRLLGPEERELFDKRVDRVALLAGRFAAKEAAIKAFGRFLSVRPQFVSIQILPDSGGQPHLRLHLFDSRRLIGQSVIQIEDREPLLPPLKMCKLHANGVGHRRRKARRDDRPLKQIAARQLNRAR